MVFHSVFRGKPLDGRKQGNKRPIYVLKRIPLAAFRASEYGEMSREAEKTQCPVCELRSLQCFVR